MYNGYLDTCMPSEAMREYLKQVDWIGWDALDIILYSPVSVYTKLDEIKKLRSESTEGEDRDYWNAAVEIMEEALDTMKEDAVYIVEQCEYDMRMQDSDGWFETVCASMHEVRNYILENVSYFEPDDIVWYQVGKWKKNTDGKFEQEAEYVFARDILSYVSLTRDLGIYDEYYGMSHLFQYWSGGDLNLPVPFKAGDIIECDGYPFGPKSHILILEQGWNVDCCGLQGLTRNPDGRWTHGAVKHGFNQHSYFPRISSLYSARIIEGELADDEKLFYEIRKFIDGDEKKGNKFCWELPFTSNDEGLTEEEVRNVLEKVSAEWQEREDKLC